MKEIERNVGQPFDLKRTLLYGVTNMFTVYLCDKKFDFKDPEFQKVCHEFDFVFYDVNQGYAVDFLPWLSPFYQNYFKHMQNLSKSVRKFILDRIVTPHKLTYKPGNIRNFVDEMIKTINEKDGDEPFDWQSALYQLEDMIGGAAGIANFVMQVLGYICSNKSVMRKVQSELDSVIGTRDVNFLDKEKLIYTEAVFWETLRHISSPIVPHVATEDTTIKGK